MKPQSQNASGNAKPHVPFAFTSLFDSLLSIYHSLPPSQQNQIMTALNEGKQTLIHQLGNFNKSASAGMEAVTKDIKRRPVLYVAAGLIAGLAFFGIKQGHDRQV